MGPSIHFQTPRCLRHRDRRQILEESPCWVRDHQSHMRVWIHRRRILVPHWQTWAHSGLWWQHFNRWKVHWPHPRPARHQNYGVWRFVPWLWVHRRCLQPLLCQGRIRWGGHQRQTCWRHRADPGQLQRRCQALQGQRPTCWAQRPLERYRPCYGRLQ